MGSSARQDSLDWSVVATLAWFGVLGRPLTIADLTRLALRERLDETEVTQSLRRLGKVISGRDQYFSLEGSQVRYPTDELERWYRYKWWRVRLAVGMFRWVPFIRLVAVANTLADRTADRDSDIDLFIIIEHGRLYSTRLLITALLQLAGLRRHGNRIANRLCLSFFATTENLDLEPIAFKPYDIYLAYWISEMTPALDEQQSFERFRAANRWVEQLVPRYHEVKHQAPSLSRVARWGERLAGGRLGNFLESRLAGWQRRRIAHKQPETAETVEADERGDVRIIATDGMLKFHEKERRRVYREHWETAMRDAGFDPQRILSDK